MTHAGDLSGWPLYRMHLLTILKASVYSLPILAVGYMCERFVRADAALEDQLRRERRAGGGAQPRPQDIRDYVLANVNSDLPIWDVRPPGEIRRIAEEYRAKKAAEQAHKDASEPPKV